jgi:hypothetical protein
MTDIIYRSIDDDFFQSEQAVQPRGESDKFGELLHRSNKDTSHPGQSGDDTIDKLIKAAMPIVNGDSMGDPSDLSSKSISNSKASPVESQSLREIQLNISKREDLFVDEKDPDPPFPDKKKRD